MERERLTFWEIIFEGLKKFAGEIIGGLLLAVFLLDGQTLTHLQSKVVTIIHKGGITRKHPNG